MHVYSVERCQSLLRRAGQSGHLGRRFTVTGGKADASRCLSDSFPGGLIGHLLGADPTCSTVPGLCGQHAIARACHMARTDEGMEGRRAGGRGGMAGFR